MFCACIKHIKQVWILWKRPRDEDGEQLNRETCAMHIIVLYSCILFTNRSVNIICKTYALPYTVMAISHTCSKDIYLVMLKNMYCALISLTLNSLLSWVNTAQSATHIIITLILPLFFSLFKLTSMCMCMLTLYWSVLRSTNDIATLVLQIFCRMCW